MHTDAPTLFFLVRRQQQDKTNFKININWKKKRKIQRFQKRLASISVSCRRIDALVLWMLNNQETRSFLGLFFHCSAYRICVCVRLCAAFDRWIQPSGTDDVTPFAPVKQKEREKTKKQKKKKNTKFLFVLFDLFVLSSCHKHTTNLLHFYILRCLRQRS